MFCPNPECPDFVEDGRPGEYIDSIHVCPKCGAELIPEWPPEPAGGESEPAAGDIGDVEPDISADALPAAGPLVAVAAYDYPDETEPLVALLIRRGLSVYQFFDDGRDFAEGSQTPPCTRVLVPLSQAELAKALLDQLESGAG